MKIVNYMRTIITLILLWFVYKEVGLLVTFVFLLILISDTLQNRINKSTNFILNNYNKLFKMLIEDVRKLDTNKADKLNSFLRN